jgi:hypothetical protein
MINLVEEADFSEFYTKILVGASYIINSYIHDG